MNGVRSQRLSQSSAVSEAHAARRDGHAAHQAEMQQLAAARDAATARHKEQIRERQFATAAEYSGTKSKCSSSRQCSCMT
jgi:hypothetical protein